MPWRTEQAGNGLLRQNISESCDCSVSRLVQIAASGHTALLAITSCKTLRRTPTLKGFIKVDSNTEAKGLPEGPRKPRLSIKTKECE